MLHSQLKAGLFSVLFFISFQSVSQSWQDVGGGTSNSSHGLLVWNNQLVNLGSFNNTPCDRVAVWDGTSWSCLGGGVGIVARAGTVWNGNLVVVGDFWNNFQPCVGCNGIAMWDGSSWQPFDNGFNNDVLTVTTWNGELIVGGDFTQANGVACSRVVRWDVNTSSFVSMGAPTDFDNDVRCMTEFQGDLWVGGDFNNVGGCSPCDGVVKWNDVTSTWEGGNSGVDLVGGVNETVRVLYVNPNDGNLYMGGEFPELIDGNVGVQDFNMGGIAMYDGSDWTSLGTGLNEYCRAITEYNGDIIAGGYFTTAGGVSANKIARWNSASQTWSALGQGFDGVGIDEYVKSAMSWNGILFAGGAYTQAEGNPMNYIAQWYEPITNPPVAAFNPSQNSGCEGVCIDFTDVSSNLPTTWNWTFSGASTSTSTDQNPTNICYPNNGTFVVQLIACNGNGCDTTTTNITIEEIPTVFVNSETICDGDMAVLTALPSIGGGDFVWSPGGETTSTINVNPSSTTVYTVDYVLNGCSSNPVNAMVVVTPVPSVTISGHSAICDNENLNLTSTPSQSGGTYQWQPTGDVTQNITDNPSNNTNYTLVYTLNGCDSPLESFPVTVNASYLQNESASVCDGDTYIYPDGFSEVVNGSSSHTSNLSSVNSCDSVIVTNVTASPTYSITENIGVCDGTSHTYPDGFVETITGNTSHTSVLSSSQSCDSIIITSVTLLSNYSGSESDIVCDGSSYTYPDGFVEVINGSSTHTSFLSSGDGCDSIVTTNVGTHPDYSLNDTSQICAGNDFTYHDGFTSTNVLNTESHTSILSSIEGCDSSITTVLLVDQSPINSVSQLNQTLTADATGVSYQWLDCANNFSPLTGETNQSFTPSSNGSYAVLIDDGNCSDTSACIDITSLSISNIEENVMNIFPNPANDIVNVELSYQSELMIRDVAGKLIWKSSNVAQKFTIDLNGFSSGTYVISCMNEHTSFSRQLIIKD